MLRRGSRGNQVRQLQQRLIDLGYDLGRHGADGIFGRDTERAVRAYQTDQGLKPDGIVGDKTKAALGREADQQTATPTGTGQTFELNGFPGSPEVWLNRETGETWVVYFVPDTEIPLLWSIDDKNLQAAFGEDQPIRYSRVFGSSEEFQKAGGILSGDHREVVDTGQDPVLAWFNTVAKQAAVRPWLADEEVLALIMEGLIENREISLAEFQQTTWWRTHSAGEREWLLLNVSDPVTANQRLESNRIAVRDTLEAMGIHQPPDSIIEFVADRFTMGRWSENYWRNQARALADPFSGIEVDADLRSLLDAAGALDTTRAMEENVRSLARRWLGPVFGDWSETQIAEWAGRLRNDADGESVLLDHLRSQRKAILPDYEDSLTWDDIASPWRNFVTQIWGQNPDETDPLFLELLRNNDLATNGQLLRQEGLDRGIGAVINAVQGEFARAFGTVRRGL